MADTVPKVKSLGKVNFMVSVEARTLMMVNLKVPDPTELTVLVFIEKERVVMLAGVIPEIEIPVHWSIVAPELVIE